MECFKSSISCLHSWHGPVVWNRLTIRIAEFYTKTESRKPES